MKYKKGTKVEVLDKREVPCGSWRRAEIVSGNGHTYRLVERVPRKVIRPRPLSAQDPVDLVAGDIIEVLDSASWKLSEVLSTVDPNYFYVRLLGSLRTLKVQRSDLRLRQCWADNRWVAIGKVFCSALSFDFALCTRGNKVNFNKGDAAERIHKLELYAYRTTMEALYSSGSITWEQEELMTNLRLELHISNDEHLSELRYLSSSKSDLPCQTDPMPQSL
ncbi:unnamed protein product [Spirodela intermedia]|uniref:ENT domain-containing protein n=1 Tax=Spirodela intermedia TaxID=51605 RepID=A0A7I8J8I1_SPIIN|nr:unnamed protein product [Spirodela intermedia]CAA6666360.1 unnamed protein product [Spirodela intermedia]